MKAEICVEISVPPAPRSQLSYNEYTDSTLHCQWEDETAMVSTVHQPSYSEYSRVECPKTQEKNWKWKYC